MQVISEDALRRKTHLSFLLPGVAGGFGGLGIRRFAWRFGGEWHPKVRAYHIYDGLALRGVILSEPFERVKAAEPDRGLVIAELLDRLGVQLCDPPLGRIAVGQIGGDLLVMLTAESEHEPDCRP